MQRSPTRRTPAGPHGSVPSGSIDLRGRRGATRRLGAGSRGRSSGARATLHVHSTEGATRVTDNDGGREQLRPVSSKVAGARIRCHILRAVDAVAGAFFVEFEEPPCHLVEASEDLCDRQPELVALYMDCVMVNPLVSTHFPCAFGVVPPLITLLGLDANVGSPEVFFGVAERVGGPAV